jgi:hypothetical protein
MTTAIGVVPPSRALSVCIVIQSWYPGQDSIRLSRAP